MKSRAKPKLVKPRVRPKVAEPKPKPGREPAPKFTVDDIPPELQVRLYRLPDGEVPYPEGLIIHGEGIARGTDGNNEDPWCAEVMLDVGWSDGAPAGAFKRHSVEVLDPTGKNVTLTQVIDDLRKAVRCYCVECTIHTHLDSERIRLLRETLELRRNVARNNGIAQDGRPDNEARIDAILTPEKAP